MGEYMPEVDDAALRIGSNRNGPHPASDLRPVHYDTWAAPTASGYSITNHTVGEQAPSLHGKPLKVLMVGAGAAGIDFLHYAKTAFKGLNVEVKCVEKNADVGGTWYENRYPGCACDGPSASYQFSWRPNPDWTRFYSGSEEIWQYMKGIAVDEGLINQVQLNTEVKEATWDEDRSVWKVVLAKVDGSRRWTEDFNVLLNGTGFLKWVFSHWIDI